MPPLRLVPLKVGVLLLGICVLELDIGVHWLVAGIRRWFRREAHGALCVDCAQRRQVSGAFGGECRGLPCWEMPSRSIPWILGFA